MAIRNEAAAAQQRVATVTRLDALFRAMSTDFLLREQFVTNPMQVLTEYVYGIQLPSDQAALSNQLLYAVVSSQSMRVWLMSIRPSGETESPRRANL